MPFQVGGVIEKPKPFQPEPFQLEPFQPDEVPEPVVFPAQTVLGQNRVEMGAYPELMITSQSTDPSEPPRPIRQTEATISPLPKKGRMAKMLSWFQPFPGATSTREEPLEKLHRILSPVQNVIEKSVTGAQVPKLLWYGISKVRPDLADKPWQQTLDELSPHEQKGVSNAVGEVAEFVSEIKTAGKLLKAVGWKAPAGKRLISRIARNAPVWMTSGAVNELVNGVVNEKDAPEIAKEVAKQTLIRGGESIVWSGVGFGAGKAFNWALTKFPRFRTGWQRWAKGKKPTEKRAARKEVDEALRIYKETGDRTQWDAVRIKYAGITPEGVERIKRRGIPSTEAKVKDFGQYPIIKAIKPPKAAKISPVKVAPEAKRPVEAPTVPPEAVEAKVEPTKATEAITEGLTKAEQALGEVGNAQVQISKAIKKHGYGGITKAEQHPELVEASEYRRKKENDLYNTLGPKHKIGDTVTYQSYTPAGAYKVATKQADGTFKETPVKEKTGKPQKLILRQAVFDLQQSVETEAQTGFPASFKLQGIEGFNPETGETITIGPHDIVNGKSLINTIQQQPEQVLQSIVQKFKGEKPKPSAELAPPTAPEGIVKPGFIDVTPLAKAQKAFMDTIEPAKKVEIKLGKPVYATVIRGIHKPEVARIEFNEQEIDNLDKNLEGFAEKLSRYSNKVLDNLMLTRGKPKDKAAISIQNDALKELAKDNPELVGTRKMIQRIADLNYKYLQSVVGDDIKYMEDYFYGVYKSTPQAKVDGFIDYWKTTKRFTKEKKLPTYADAKAYGLQIRNPNPVHNLMSEYIAIARLDGMIQMKDELMRTGKGKYIWPAEEAPPHSDKVPEPVFKDVRMDPDLAKLIKNLISTNKVYRHWGLNTLRKINNALRTAKFAFSAFHQLNIAKQSLADNGYLTVDKSSTRGITTGFRKNDPIFKTKMYKDYIEHGGGHRYSIESEAQRAFTNFVESLDKKLGLAFKVGALPIRMPKTYVKWMFQSYIPKVKYAKYCDAVSKRDEKLGRELTSPEKIDIIKEQQNFYGMMNERLFGRSGTTTTVLRFFFMAPGYGEGNYRTILKAGLQWGTKEGFKANRSRSNIVNALLMSATAATVGTLIMTGKPPKAPRSIEDVRDLFKIDTGRKDYKGRRIMIDMLTFDKDYWDIYGNMLTGQFEKAAKAPWNRLTNMKATTIDWAVDLANIAQGKALYNWQGDKVVEVTDPFAQQVLQFLVHEIKKTEPISSSVFRRSKARKQSTALSALTALFGYRPTLTERDKRQQAELQRMYELKGRQEELYNYVTSLRNPRASVERYNQKVRNVIDNVSPRLAAEWRPKLIIDTQRYLENKAYYLSQKNRTPKEIERTRHILKSFEVTQADLQLYLQRYWQRERKKPVRSVESIPVIGRNIKKKRAIDRYQD